MSSQAFSQYLTHFTTDRPKCHSSEFSQSSCFLWKKERGSACASAGALVWAYTLLGIRNPTWSHHHHHNGPLQNPAKCITVCTFWTSQSLRCAKIRGKVGSFILLLQNCLFSWGMSKGEVSDSKVRALGKAGMAVGKRKAVAFLWNRLMISYSIFLIKFICEIQQSRLRGSNCKDRENCTMKIMTKETDHYHQKLKPRTRTHPIHSWS